MPLEISFRSSLISSEDNMVRLTRHADYGIVLLTHMVIEDDGRVFSARGLAEATGLPQAIVWWVWEVLGDWSCIRTGSLSIQWVSRRMVSTMARWPLA